MSLPKTDYTPCPVNAVHLSTVQGLNGADPPSQISWLRPWVTLDKTRVLNQRLLYDTSRTENSAHSECFILSTGYQWRIQVGGAVGRSLPLLASALFSLSRFFLSVLHEYCVMGFWDRWRRAAYIVFSSPPPTFQNFLIRQYLNIFNNTAPFLSGFWSAESHIIILGTCPCVFLVSFRFTCLRFLIQVTTLCWYSCFYVCILYVNLFVLCVCTGMLKL